MKKFLFTLATVFAFGLMANAATAPGLALDPATVTVAPGETIPVDIVLTSDADVDVKGLQMQVGIFDEAHNLIGEGVTIEQVNIGTPRQPNYVYFVPGVALTGTNNFSQAENLINNIYRVVLNSPNLNAMMLQDEYSYDMGEGIKPVVATLNVKMAEGYEGEYVTVEFMNTDTFLITWSFSDGSKNTVANADLPKATVTNSEYSGGEQPKNIDGTVTLGDLDGNFDAPVTINMVDPTEGYVTVVTVNSNEAAIENGVVVLPDVAGEYIVAVEITAEGYEGKVEASRTYTIEQAAEPQIAVDETSGYMTITAKPATSLVVAGYETFTDEDGSLYVVVPRPEAETGTTVAYTATNTEEGKLPNTVTGEATATPKAKTASNAPTFRMDPYDEYVLIYAEGTGTVTMTDAQGNAIDNPVRVERPAYGQEAIEVTVYATNLDNGWYTATNGSQNFTIQPQGEKVYETPAPNVTYDEATHTITATGEGTVAIYIAGQQEPVATGNGTVYYVIPQTDQEQYVGYWATADAGQKEGYDTVLPGTSQTAYAYVAAMPTLQGDVTVSVDAEGNVTAVYNGNEQGVTVTVNPSKLDNYGTYTVEYTATAEGYQDLTGTAIVVYNAPVQERADAPDTHKANYVYKDPVNGVYYNAYTVTLSQPETSDDEEYVIYYRIGVMDANGEYVYPENYTQYTGPFNVAQEGTYMVEAYAVAKDKSQSTFAYDGFTVSVAVSIEELFAGENVANVRYFNVAGQEMQEINGLTIVVTTYTDGTQSAVKVMK